MTEAPAPETQEFVMNGQFWTATALFILMYVAIVTEKIDKTVVAIFGAGLVLILKVLDQHDAFHTEAFGIDWNVIFLLISMMTIVNLIRPTGLFEYVAIKSAKWGRGEPLRIMLIFAVITAVFSALLDNVTTVLLLAPVTLFIADALEVDPVPFLIVEALASNIGGTATLIGDPPNIMIASKAKLDFMSFVTNLAPVVVIMMIVFLIVVRLLFSKHLSVSQELKERILAMDERSAIKDKAMLFKGLFVLTLVLIGFVFHGIFHYQPASIALFGAGLLLVISNTRHPHKILAEIEWPTIFFFMGLFIVIGGVVKVGLIKLISAKVLALTEGNLLNTSMLVMWFSAVASAFVDNIPYVATMNPLIINMAHHLWPDLQGTALLHHPDLMPLWWSLALGSCLGGNGTAIGASANVIVVGMAEQNGKKISFLRFMAYGFPIMLLTVAISAVYVWLRYYVFQAL